jgi:AcrR family transcriptional regulator
MRADARRNYQHILEVAREVFTEDGPEAPLDDIARRAGVGAGTLYRHFPNRDALIEAVYRDDIERLSDLAHDLLKSRPSDALPIWIREHVQYALHRKGLAMTLKAALGADREIFQLCKTLINDAAAALLIPAQQAGAVRSDVQPRDVLRLAHGIALATENDPDAAERLLRVMLDGLRPPAPGHR